jgi:hypothetical protein
MVVGREIVNWIIKYSKKEEECCGGKWIITKA